MQQRARAELGVIETFARRPALPAAILFIVGLLSQNILPSSPAVYLVTAGSLALLALCVVRLNWLSIVCLAIALWLAGAAAMQLESRYPSDHIGLFTSHERQLVEMEIRLDDWPRLIEPAPAGYVRQPHQVVTADALQIKTRDGYRPCTGKVVVQIHEPIDELSAGQTLRVFGWLERPEPAANPGQFDWYHYHRDQDVLATLTVARGENIQILQQQRRSMLALLQHKTRELLDAGFTKEQALNHDLLRALVVGDKNPELRDIQELFAQSGTSHHLAVSGMHVAILGGFVYLLCRIMCLRPRHTAWIVIGFVVLYGLVVLPAPPAIRAVLLCATLLFGVTLRRSVDMIQLLALCAMLMLMIRPLDLYNPGFQLSFGTVLGLMALSPKLQAFFESLEDPDKKVARLLQPPKGLAYAFLQFKHWMLGVFSGACVAWVISLPMILLHFDRLNPWAIAAGIALFPVTITCVIAGLLKIVCTLVLPVWAQLWAALACLPIQAMRSAVAKLALLPGSGVAFPPPPIWLIAIYYAFLLLYLLPIPKRKWTWTLPLVACFGCIAFPIFKPASHDLRVTILSVGAGSCAVVQTPTGKTIVIDAGSSTYPDAYRSVVEPFLRHEHIRNIDAIYISHANTDHYNAAAGIAEHSAAELRLTPQFSLDARHSSTAREFLAGFEHLHRTPRTFVAGDQIHLDPNASLEILWPPDDPKLSDNDSSMVLRLTFAGRSILFTGDIQQSAEHTLSFDSIINHADVLIAPHHGSSEITTPDFVKAVNPRFIVSSNDSTLTGKQRRFETMIDHRPLYRSDRCGATFVTISPTGNLSLSTFLSDRSKSASTAPPPD